MTIENERAHINHAKSELRNYKYLLNVCHGIEGKILKLETILQGVKSPSAQVEVGDGNGDSKLIRQQDMRDKINAHKYDLAAVRYRTARVDAFLDGLPFSDCKIVTDVYLNGKHIETVARENYCSEKSLRRNIDAIMKKF